MTEQVNKKRANRNKTITLSASERDLYRERLVKLTKPADLNAIINKTINQDIFEALDLLPSQSIDILFLDPPYNLTKSFNGSVFKKSNHTDYEKWFTSWFEKTIRLLKPTSSIYICGDWRSSSVIERVASKYLTIQNRITWEREKGRGAKSNWKNCSEDIWFATVSDKYTFNLDDIKIKRKVIAPYKVDGEPKDWIKDEVGNFRLTYPSNLWTDLTVPFWSMSENTDHPTQKPEKLLARIILASSNKGDIVLDPFLGSGTTSVVAKKLSRKYIGIEIDEYYSCLAEKRLATAGDDGSIQGYKKGVFWERNSLSDQKIKVRVFDFKKALF